MERIQVETENELLFALASSDHRYPADEKTQYGTWDVLQRNLLLWHRKAMHIWNAIMISNAKCWQCQVVGHTMGECPEKEKKAKRPRTESPEAKLLPLDFDNLAPRNELDRHRFTEFARLTLMIEQGCRLKALLVEINDAGHAMERGVISDNGDTYEARRRSWNQLE